MRLKRNPRAVGIRSISPVDQVRVIFLPAVADSPLEGWRTLRPAGYLARRGE